MVFFDLKSEARGRCPVGHGVAGLGFQRPPSGAGSAGQAHPAGVSGVGAAHADPVGVQRRQGEHGLRPLFFLEFFFFTH